MEERKMKEMRVYLEGRSWVVAKYIDGEPDRSVVDLFGTHVLPTPYLAAMSGQDVIGKLQSINPGVLVQLV